MPVVAQRQVPVVDNGMPRSSSTTVVWLVLLVPTHLALCWLFRCVHLIVGKPKGSASWWPSQVASFVVVIPQVQFLDKFVVPVWCDSTGEVLGKVRRARVVVTTQVPFLDKVICFCDATTGL